MLRGQLALVALVVGLVYPFIDLLNGMEGNIPYYVVVILLALLTMYLNRKQKFLLANFVFLTLINALVFRFAATDPTGTGVHIFFVCASITSLALFGYHYKKYAVIFILVSLGLFLASYFFDFPGMDRLSFTEEYVKISFTTNFIIALITCGAIVYFLIDVNHHSETEILAKNKELEKANSELDRFVYSASHDLKAPLSSMRGLIDLAKRTDNVEDIKEMLIRMDGAVNNLNHFINDIIHYSRNSRKEIVISTFDLTKLVKEVIEDLKYSDKADQVYITCDISDSFEISTDMSRLKVILSNLVSNSIKHHDPEKADKHVIVSATKKPNLVTIRVSDNGIGIEDVHHSRIFDMFYRASERAEGSGLGLFIVNETITRLQGKIYFDSKPNEGSEFIVEIPS